MKTNALLILLILLVNPYINGVSGQVLTIFDPCYTTTYIPVIACLKRPTTKSTGIAAASYIDTNFKTLVYRYTDVGGSPDPGQMHLRHEYSRKQAFNTDNSKFIAQATNGYWYLYNVFMFVGLSGRRDQVLV